VLVLNYELETPQDYADLAEFLTGDGSVNINGGENWAQKRIELGIVEPVKVAIWELGNELDLKVSKYTPQYYIDKSLPAITAIKGVCPDAKFAAIGATAPWSGTRDWRGWNTAVLQGLGNQVDYLTFHPYYGRVQSAMNNMENYMNEMKQQILTSTGSDRIKLYVSEHGVYPSDVNDQTTWTQTYDLKGTLATGAFIGRLFKRTDVAFSTTHAFNGGPWRIISRDQTLNSRYTSGIAEMTSAFYKAVGERVVKSTLTGDNIVNLEPTAMLTNNGLNLVIFNLDPDIKRDLNFNFSLSPYKLKKEVIVTADALDSFNSLTEKKINTTEKELSNSGVFSSYTIPEKSMVVLYLERIAN
jgi:alpha-L-arabinofuranosidase